MQISALLQHQECQQSIKSLITRSIEVHQQLLADEYVLEQIHSSVKTIEECLQNGHKLLFFGNGGSAADAQHIAGEFVGRFLKERRALPALALTVNSSTITAVGNDYSYDHIFARQVEAFGLRGDVAIGISTSGNSMNVVKGLKAAKAQELVTIGLVGGYGGKIQAMADYCITVPSHETPRIQECHILIGHILAALVEENLFEDELVA